MAAAGAAEGTAGGRTVIQGRVVETHQENVDRIFGRRPPANPATGRVTGASPAPAPARAAPAAGAGTSAPPAAPDDDKGGVRLPGRKSYTRVVMAEFAVTVILIAASPILTSRKSGAAGDAASAVAGVSLAGPLVRLTAAVIVFFALALMSTGEKSGKFAAALGGLVMLGTALNASDMFGALANAFGGGKPTAQAQAVVAQNAPQPPGTATHVVIG